MIKGIIQLKCPTIDDWLKKLWYVYVRECYSAIRRDEILPFATTWMDLEIIMLSEISQTEKNENHMISQVWDINLKATTTTKVEINPKIHRTF